MRTILVKAEDIRTWDWIRVPIETDEGPNVSPLGMLEETVLRLTVHGSEYIHHQEHKTFTDVETGEVVHIEFEGSPI